MNKALRELLDKVAKAHPTTLPANLADIVGEDLANGLYEEPGANGYAEGEGVHIAYGLSEQWSLVFFDGVLAWAGENDVPRAEILGEWADELCYAIGQDDDLTDAALERALDSVAKAHGIEPPACLTLGAS